MRRITPDILMIALAGRGDLDRIIEIERVSFSAPWTRKMFEAELDGNPFGSLLTARFRTEDDDLRSVIGYICYWVVFEELRFMNLGVDPALRRQGIASTLIQHALKEGAERGAVRAFLEVRATNEAAVALYDRAGFRAVGKRPRYYINPVEDAVLMELNPLPPPVTGGRPDLSPIDAACAAGGATHADRKSDC
jgi:ribosomal-protein-alanine N-acetyltransferase